MITSKDRLSAVIIGAQKSGTTSLLRYLQQHPSVAAHRSVEFPYFEIDEEYMKGWDAARKRYFPPTDATALVTKSAGLYMNDEGLGRLARHNPECLVILMLRDPTERAWSSYRMERDAGAGRWEPFENIMKASSDQNDLFNRYFLQWGDYPSALRRAYRHFDRAQVMTIIFNDFIVDPAATCRSVFQSLGLDPEVEIDCTTIYNARRVLRSQLYQQLIRKLRSAKQVTFLTKLVLPDDVYRQMGDFLIGSNKLGLLDEPIPTEIRDFLDRYYECENRVTEQLLGRAVPW